MQPEVLGMKPVQLHFLCFSHLAAAADYLPAHIRSDLYALPDGFDLLLYDAPELPNAVYEFGEALPCPPSIPEHLAKQGELIIGKRAVSVLQRAFAGV